MAVEATALLLVAAEALHRQDVAHALLDVAGGHGAGGATRLAATAHEPGPRRDGEPLQRQDEEREVDHLRGVAVVEGHHQQDHEGGEDGEHRRHDELVEDVGERRRVVHHPVEAVADALVVQHRHRQCLDAFEQLRAQQVVQRLGEAQLQAELDEAEDAGELAERGVGLVLGLGCRVVAFFKLALRVVGGPGRGAEGAEHDHHEGAETHDVGHHLHRAHAVEKTHESPEVGRERLGRDRHAEDHVVDDDLQRPRQYQGRQQGQPHDEELGGEPGLEVADVGHRAQDDAQRLAEVCVGVDVERARGRVELALAVAQRALGD